MLQYCRAEFFLYKCTSSKCIIVSADGSKIVRFVEVFRNTWENIILLLGQSSRRLDKLELTRIERTCRIRSNFCGHLFPFYAQGIILMKLKHLHRYWKCTVHTSMISGYWMRPRVHRNIQVSRANLLIQKFNRSKYFFLWCLLCVSAKFLKSRFPFTSKTLGIFG